MFELGADRIITCRIYQYDWIIHASDSEKGRQTFCNRAFSLHLSFSWTFCWAFCSAFLAATAANLGTPGSLRFSVEEDVNERCAWGKEG